MIGTPQTDELAQKFSKTWNQFAHHSDEDIAKQFQNTDDALDLARQLERELAEVSGQRDLAVEELEIIANMIKKVLKECGK